mmetsp:Transcript_90521/g.235738  ORF Transcript_90521/g.235738 Transcript_90521/m.235738 type:complete len:239 (+) Transcript_90521:415-1131(+)
MATSLRCTRFSISVVDAIGRARLRRPRRARGWRGASVDSITHKCHSMIKLSHFVLALPLDVHALVVELEALLGRIDTNSKDWLLPSCHHERLLVTTGHLRVATDASRNTSSLGVALSLGCATAASVRILILSVKYAIHLLHDFHDPIVHLATNFTVVFAEIDAIHELLLTEGAARCLVRATCVLRASCRDRAIALQVESSLHSRHGRESPAAPAVSLILHRGDYALLSPIPSRWSILR